MDLVGKNIRKTGSEGGNVSVTSWHDDTETTTTDPSPLCTEKWRAEYAEHGIQTIPPPPHGVRLTEKRLVRTRAVVGEQRRLDLSDPVARRIDGGGRKGQGQTDVGIPYVAGARVRNTGG